jgi:hypothetical protein
MIAITTRSLIRVKPVRLLIAMLRSRREQIGYAEVSIPYSILQSKKSAATGAAYFLD